MAKILLDVAAGASPWHDMPATVMLAEYLQQFGHEVVNFTYHTRTIDAILCNHNPDFRPVLKWAEETIANVESDPAQLYLAWETIERISKRVPYAGEFYVRHNNFHFTSKHDTNTIDGLMKAIADRENNLWYSRAKDFEAGAIVCQHPDIYGLSVTDPRQLENGCIMAGRVKELSPDTIVILGGNFFAQVPAAREHKDFGKFGQFCDAVCYREGFKPLKELAATLDPSQASGVVWFKDGKAIINPPTDEPVDFATLPRPRPWEVHTWLPIRVRTLFTQSNCPFRCEFCAIPAGSDTYHNKPRARPPKQIALDIVAAQAKYVSFADECMPIERQLEIGAELKRLGWQAIWRAFMNFEEGLLYSSVCRDLYDAGLRICETGFESLSPKTLTQARKRFNRPEDYATILRNLHGAGINSHVFLMTGYPGEHILDTLCWLPFIADNPPTTAVGGRFQIPQMSLIGQSGGKGYEKYIRIHLPTDKPLRPNLDFEYLDYEDEDGKLVRMNHKIVRAVRTILEECFRRVPCYPATSSCIKWEHRLLYRPEELEEIARQLPPPEVDSHLAPALKLIGNYLGAEFELYEDLLEFMRRYVAVA